LASVTSQDIEAPIGYFGGFKNEVQRLVAG